MLVFEPIQARWEGGLFHSPLPCGRAKVPGGWLVGVVSGTTNAQVVLCFVPDPEHRWDGKSIPDSR